MSATDSRARQSVEDLLSCFDGDVEQAVAAIKRYHRQTRVKEVRFDTTDAPVIIHAVDLKKAYKVGRTKVEALRGASLQIKQGEFVAITGSSGSGKSTLLQLLGGLDKPSEGTVEVNGQNLARLSDSRLSEFRGRTLGFVFQFFYLQPFLRLEQNLEVPGMFSGTRSSARKEHARVLAQKVGLDDRLRHFPRELSGGQMQRAAIARALLNNPKILLADEPTGNLDSVNSTAIIELFEAIRSQYGTTVVVVTHDQAIADRADRTIAMKDGVVL